MLTLFQQKQAVSQYLAEYLPSYFWFSKDPHTSNPLVFMKEMLSVAKSYIVDNIGFVAIHYIFFRIL
jgi:hypothetical protein